MAIHWVSPGAPFGRPVAVSTSDSGERREPAKDSRFCGSLVLSVVPASLLWTAVARIELGFTVAHPASSDLWSVGS